MLGKRKLASIYVGQGQRVEFRVISAWQSEAEWRLYYDEVREKNNIDKIDENGS